jgi:hypothetical protein
MNNSPVQQGSLIARLPATALVGSDFEWKQF